MKCLRFDPLWFMVGFMIVAALNLILQLVLAVTS
jgi:hypothetical protein